MKSPELKYNLRKTVLSSALAALIPVSTAVADTYVWGTLNGSAADPATCGASSDAMAVTFTMVNPVGDLIANSDTTNMAGKQTATCGTLTYDTVTKSGTAEIVAFSFFGSGVAAAQSITVDLLQAPNDLNVGNLFLANMLFNWNSNNGIPVSLVWDAQGLMNEMDGSPTSFSLNADGSIVGGTGAVYSAGAVPFTDGSVWFSFGGTDYLLGLGASPLAMRSENTPNITVSATECQLGVDAVYTDNTGGGCMGITPSADKNQPLIVDAATNTATSQTGTGMGGSPMQDGPFKSYNANFDVTAVTLVSFTDTTKPVVTLTGSNTINLIVGDPAYTGGSATCVDAAPLNAYTYTAALDTASAALVPISTASPSTTVLTYECTDASGNIGTATRTVNVKAPDAVITLNADGNSDVSPVTQECAVAYVDAGATCNDPEDGQIFGTDNPLAGNLFSVDTSDVDANISNVGGPYLATWSCTDSAANTSIQSRDVNVVDTTAPVVTPTNGTVENIVSSTADNPLTYSDMGATATDSCDPSFPLNLSTATSGSVTMVVPDTGPDVITSSLSYTATDADGNSATAVLAVNVTRSQPVMSLVGGGLVLSIGQPYVEQGMDVVDAQNGTFPGITSSGACGAMTCTINTGSLDINTAGTYTVTYDVIDSDGNNATQLTRTVQVGAYAEGSNFSMLNAQGTVIGGTNDVVFTWDQTENSAEADTNFNMTISSALPQPFFGAIWTAHHVRAFGPGTYSFDTGCTVAEMEATGCPAGSATNSGLAMSMTVGAGQVGAHMLFDYNGNENIDVVIVWNKDAVWDDPDGVDGPTNNLFTGDAGLAPDPTTTWKLVSTDVDGDGINGSPMVDGPFIGFSANFNAGPGATAAPPPPITTTVVDTKLGGALSWLMLLGILPLTTLFRRTRK